VKRVGDAGVIVKERHAIHDARAALDALHISRPLARTHAKRDRAIKPPLAATPRALPAPCPLTLCRHLAQRQRDRERRKARRFGGTQRTVLGTVYTSANPVSGLADCGLEFQSQFRRARHVSSD
jgi:hypothetical protein